MVVGRSRFESVRMRPIDPRRHSRDALIAWARHNCPDLRLGYAIVDGQRRCFAAWTFGGLEYEREADDEETLAREIVTALARLMRLPVQLDRDETTALEREIVDAARSGNAAVAEQLGRELVLRNEGLVPQVVRARFRV